MTKIRKNVQIKKVNNFAIYLFLASIKDAQATGETFSPQKRTSSTLNREISFFSVFLWVLFVLRDLDPDPDPNSQCGSGSGSGSSRPKSMRI
jgi:hypothetical protein